MDDVNLNVSSDRLDVIAKVDGDEVIAELDVRNNASVRVGDRYIATLDDKAKIVMQVVSFRSAEDYSNTIARRIDAMREGVAEPPNTMTARKTYQRKLAVLRIEGEILPDGTRRVGAGRVPEVMKLILPISDALLEQFVTSLDGNLILGNLVAGSRKMRRVARIRQNYAGQRMIVLGMPGKGKTQLIRSLLSQAMAE